MDILNPHIVFLFLMSFVHLFPNRFVCVQKLRFSGDTLLHHYYLGFLISKSHIQDLNPTFGFQKSNLAFTNLVYKRALTRVLQKNNLGFKNQIWFFKLSFENQIYHLKTKFINSKTVFRKPHLYLKHTFGLLYWNPDSFFENQICFISKNRFKKWASSFVLLLRAFLGRLNPSRAIYGTVLSPRGDMFTSVIL